MNSAVIILIAAAIYVGLYFSYGKALQNKVVRADPNRPTPAHKLYDGVDYVPANPVVLYGHHFASIAGAGPIVGPAVAMAWGWLPGLLWVWFGNVFIGAVHDYLALMSSVRYDGKSVQWIAGKLMSKRTSMAFELYVWFSLVLVVAAFGAVISGIFYSTPGAATASWLFMLVAVILGLLLYKWQIDFKLGTVIGILMLIGAIYVGFKYPIHASTHTWLIALGLYVIIASSLPVWILLQPRDYLNAYILWFGLILGGLAFIIVGIKGVGTFTAPAFTSWSANVVGGKPSPFWPTIPLVIACGALSGFHSIVGSGTTSKQLDNELHGLMVGYGGMFTEGFLSTLVISSIAVYGLQVFQTLKIPVTYDNWGSQYAIQVVSHKLKVGIFAKSYALGVHNAFGVSAEGAALFASLWVAAFALTTLDTATRLGRFAWQEIMEMAIGGIQAKIKEEEQKLRESKEKKESKLLGILKTLNNILEALKNKWVASLILVFFGIYMAWGGNWLIIWPAFSGMNQMLASIALMTASLWVAKVQNPKGTWKWAVIIPALFLWITVTAALIWFLVYVSIPKGQTWVSIITIVGLLLNLMLVIDWYVAWKKPAEEYAAMAS
ncbi:carbon starvation protein A [Thermococcus sp. 21S9]|uniref:carbon starvation CstA family protein n=1 Tax=Thermococcus sp. 21S9 TaxID=1638223 RepID=UPI001439BA0B|nr:carbon starvation protein A [Thermococcus sp. 21S9]NJE53654.1 carbon starvation protein A [Thermococcus sp. 21S9]